MALAQLDFETIRAHRTARPFLKWAGGKSSLLPVLSKFAPKDFKNYVEPFVGGGAMFFSVQPESGILGDANGELIACYEAVRDTPEAVIISLSKYKVSSEEFYRVRAQNPRVMSVHERAARMIFLNKTCFNGLYRVNRSGQFNSPFGHYKSLRLVDEENLYAASEALKVVRLLHMNYESLLLDLVEQGDFVYLDPPYLPISIHSDFKRYTAGQFRETDHIRLAEVFRELDTRGAMLLLSNSFHPLVEKLYSGFRIETVAAPRFINCKGSSRGDVKELLVTNF